MTKLTMNFNSPWRKRNGPGGRDYRLTRSTRVVSGTLSLVQLDKPIFVDPLFEGIPLHMMFNKACDMGVGVFGECLPGIHHLDELASDGNVRDGKCIAN